MLQLRGITTLILCAKYLVNDEISGSHGDEFKKWCSGMLLRVGW
jgi:hypothetical protein